MMCHYLFNIVYMHIFCLPHICEHICFNAVIDLQHSPTSSAPPAPGWANQVINSRATFLPQSVPASAPANTYILLSVFVMRPETLKFYTLCFSINHKNTFKRVCNY
ncbi:hypothetical protein AMECASPLE_023507 [Ameca splendens]|uniref:Secreted protein n=1 Tax=Ameca splendens TaxID=208324 RepID=A0ABV1A0L0_9TELE